MGNQSSYNQKTTGVPSMAPKAVKRVDSLLSSKWYDTEKKQYEKESFFLECQMRHSKLLDSLTAVEELRSNPDPQLTSAAHSVKINAAVKKMSSQLNGFVVSNDQFAFGGNDRVQTIINEKTSLTEDTRSSEVRTALRVMSPEDRRAAMGAALESGDRVVLGSVLHGSAMLSGMTEKEKQNYKDRYMHLYAKDETELARATKKAGEKLSEASLAALKHLEALKVDVQSEEIASAAWASKEFESALINLNNQAPVMDLSTGFK